MPVDQRRARMGDGVAEDEGALHENTSGACVLQRREQRQERQAENGKIVARDPLEQADRRPLEAIGADRAEHRLALERQHVVALGIGKVMHRRARRSRPCSRPRGRSRASATAAWSSWVLPAQPIELFARPRCPASCAEASPSSASTWSAPMTTVALDRQSPWPRRAPAQPAIGVAPFITAAASISRSLTPAGRASNASPAPQQGFSCRALGGEDQHGRAFPHCSHSVKRGRCSRRRYQARFAGLSPCRALASTG